MHFSRSSCLSRPSRRFGSPLAIFLLVLFASTTALSSSAQGTKLWTQSRFEEFEKGTPQGVEITSDGKLHAGPTATELLTTPSSFVWSVAAASNINNSGAVFLGTGSPATLLRAVSDGKGGWRTDKIFETSALAVQVVRVGPDGAVYAATMPDGKVYRLKPDAASAFNEASAEVVFDLNKADGTGSAQSDAKKNESRSRYIWDMTFDQSDRLYIATGGPAAVYRIDLKQGKAEAFFKNDEQHVRSLAWDKAGNLLAGTDGSGLVYRISPDGKAYVLFSAPRREITALAVGADGTVYTSDVGDRSRNPLPQLPVQTGTAGITISFVQPGSMQAANASTSLPEGTEVYALTPNAAPRKIWSGKDEIVYQLAAVQGGLMALTGNRGRMLMIHDDGSFSDFAHLEAQQATAFTAIPGGWLVGTSNTGKLYQLSVTSKDSKAGHEYASDVLDAGATSRWGRVEIEPGSHGYQIWTRTGNVEQPVRNAKDWGWSDWQQAASDRIVSPVGRYLQWKVVLGDNGGSVGGVGINYLPINSAPAVDDVIVVPGARVSPQPLQQGQPATVSIAFPTNTPTGGGASDANAAPIQAQKDRTAVTVRWAAHDDNGDDLIFDLFLRGDDEHTWRLLKKGLTEKAYSFDSAMIPDGGYQVRVVASDAPSHTPGEVLTGELVSDRFEIDTTAPVISNLKADSPLAGKCGQTSCLSIPVTFDAKDAMSPISKAEYSLDAGPWQYVEPVGALSDSREEHYAFSIPIPANSTTEIAPESEHLVTVRAYDRRDNMAVAKVVVRASKAGEK